MAKATQNDAPDSPGTVPEPLWTDAQVSEYFHGKIAVRTLANWRVARKGPPFVRLGANRSAPVFYRPSAVAEWAKDHEVPTSGGAAA